MAVITTNGSPGIDSFRAFTAKLDQVADRIHKAILVLQANSSYSFKPNGDRLDSKTGSFSD
jgi:hypothetical protein